MTAKKQRKSLGDRLATNFVYGDNAPTEAAKPVAKPISQRERYANEPVETIAPAPEQIVTTSNPISLPSSPSLMSKLIQQAPPKEATVRLTVDLPQSTHKKLSLLCAENGLKKAEVVRMLLDEALKEVNT
jgi:hypothetical protein